MAGPGTPVARLIIECQLVCKQATKGIETLQKNQKALEKTTKKSTEGMRAASKTMSSTVGKQLTSVGKGASELQDQLKSQLSFKPTVASEEAKKRMSELLGQAKSYYNQKNSLEAKARIALAKGDKKTYDELKKEADSLGQKWSDTISQRNKLSIKASKYLVAQEEELRKAGPISVDTTSSKAIKQMADLEEKAKGYYTMYQQQSKVATSLFETGEKTKALAAKRSASAYLGMHTRVMNKIVSLQPKISEGMIETAKGAEEATAGLKDIPVGVDIGDTEKKIKEVTIPTKAPIQCDFICYKTTKKMIDDLTKPREEVIKCKTEAEGTDIKDLGEDVKKLKKDVEDTAKAGEEIHLQTPVKDVKNLKDNVKDLGNTGDKTKKTMAKMTLDVSRVGIKSKWTEKKTSLLTSTMGELNTRFAGLETKHLTRQFRWIGRDLMRVGFLSQLAGGFMLKAFTMAARAGGDFGDMMEDIGYVVGDMLDAMARPLQAIGQVTEPLFEMVQIFLEAHPAVAAFIAIFILASALFLIIGGQVLNLVGVFLVLRYGMMGIAEEMGILKVESTGLIGVFQNLGKAMKVLILGLPAVSYEFKEYKQISKDTGKSLQELWNTAGAGKKVNKELAKTFGGEAEAINKVTRNTLMLKQRVKGLDGAIGLETKSIDGLLMAMKSGEKYFLGYDNILYKMQTTMKESSGIIGRMKKAWQSTGAEITDWKGIKVIDRLKLSLKDTGIRIIAVAKTSSFINNLSDAWSDNVTAMGKVKGMVGVVGNALKGLGSKFKGFLKFISTWGAGVVSVMWGIIITIPAFADFFEDALETTADLMDASGITVWLERLSDILERFPYLAPVFLAAFATFPIWVIPLLKMMIGQFKQLIGVGKKVGQVGEGMTTIAKTETGVSKTAKELGNLNKETKLVGHQIPKVSKPMYDMDGAVKGLGNTMKGVTSESGVMMKSMSGIGNVAGGTINQMSAMGGAVGNFNSNIVGANVAMSNAGMQVESYQYKLGNAIGTMKDTSVQVTNMATDFGAVSVAAKGSAGALNTIKKRTSGFMGSMKGLGSSIGRVVGLGILFAAVFQVMEPLFEAMSDALEPIMDALSPLFEILAAWIEENPELAAGIFLSIAGLLLLGPTLGKVGKSFGIFGEGGAEAGGTAIKFNATLPAIIASVAALVAAFSLLIDSFSKSNMSFEELGILIGIVSVAAIGIIAAVQGITKVMGTSATGTEGFALGIAAIVGAISALVGAFSLLIKFSAESGYSLEEILLLIAGVGTVAVGMVIAIEGITKALSSTSSSAQGFALQVAGIVIAIAALIGAFGLLIKFTTESGEDLMTSANFITQVALSVTLLVGSIAALTALLGKFGTAWDSVAFAAIVASIAALVLAFGTLAASVAPFKDDLGALTGFINNLALTMGILVGVIGALAAILSSATGGLGALGMAAMGVLVAAFAALILSISQLINSLVLFAQNWGAIKQVLLEIGPTIVQSIENTVDAILDMLNNKIPKWVLAFTIGLSKIGKTIKKNGPKIVKAMGDIASGVGQILGGLAGTIPQVVAGFLMGFEQQLRDAAPKINDAWAGICDSLGSISAGAFSGVLSGVSTFLTDIERTINREGPKISTAWSGIVTGISNAVTSMTTTVVNNFGQMITNILAAVTGVVGKIAGAFIGLAEKILENVGNMIAVGTKIVSDIIIGIGDAALTIGDVFMDVATKIANKIGDMIALGTQIMTDIITGIGDAVLTIADVFIGTATKIAEKIGDMLVLGGDLITDIITGLGDVVTTIADTFIGTAKKIGEKIGDLLAVGKQIIIDIVWQIGQDIGDIADEFINVATNIGTKIGSMIDTGADIIKDIVKGMSDNVSDVIDAIGDMIVDIASEITDNIYKISDASGGIVTTIKDSITGGIDTIKDAVGDIIAHIIAGCPGGGLSDFPILGENAGGLLIEGMAGALGTGIGDVKGVLGDIVTGAAEAGKQVAEFVAGGIIEAATVVGAAIGTIGDVITGGITGILTELDKFFCFSHVIPKGILEATEPSAKAINKVGQVIINGIGNIIRLISKYSERISEVIPMAFLHAIDPTIASIKTLGTAIESELSKIGSNLKLEIATTTPTIGAGAGIALGGAAGITNYYNDFYITIETREVSPAMSDLEKRALAEDLSELIIDRLKVIT